MKTLTIAGLASFFILLFNPTSSVATTGFSLPDSLNEFSIQYKTVDNLILLPVKINNNTEVNLILDTGCRNIVLFGKQFLNKLKWLPDQVVEFSGMGSGKNVKGKLSIENRVAIDKVKGENVPIVIVPTKNVFRDYIHIDGIIGYDIFLRFEIELNPAKQLITFRTSLNNSVPDGYSRIPISVVDSKPVIHSTILMEGQTITSDLIIDTGSTLGLLLKSTNKEKFRIYNQEIIGQGLNGVIKGRSTTTNTLRLPQYELNDVDTGIIHSPWHDYASIGMGILKEYSIILNYAQSYVCLKKNG